MRPGEVSLDEVERAFRETPGPPESPPTAPPAPPSDPVPSKPVRPDRSTAIEREEEDREKLDSKVASQSIRVNVDTWKI